MIAPNSCACCSCQQICRNCPCVGTPEDIAKIIAAGEHAKIVPTFYAPLSLLAVGVKPRNILAPLMTPSGCVFLDKAGLCTLHDRGLKPTEGKLASCKNTPQEALEITLTVLDSWKPYEHLL